MCFQELEIMSRPVDQCVVEKSIECLYEGHTIPQNKTEQIQFKENFSPEYLYPSDVILYFCGHHPECTKLGSKVLRVNILSKYSTP